VVVVVSLPSSVGSSSIESVGVDEGVDDSKLVSPAIHIETHGDVNHLSEPVTLCFRPIHNNTLPPLSPPSTSRPAGGCKKESHESVCLSFKTGRGFECVDNRLNRTMIGGSELVCGSTSHLSTFALLLAVSSDTKCADSPFFWAAIGLLGGVCLLITLLLLLEWRVKAIKMLVLGEESFENHKYRRDISRKKQERNNHLQSPPSTPILPN